MSAKTRILTDEQILNTLANTYCCSLSDVILHDAIAARAIEQAVLESPEIEAMQRDSDRYRWLRSPASVDILDVHHWDGEISDGEALDSYIDEAMGASDD